MGKPRNETGCGLESQGTGHQKQIRNSDVMQVCCGVSLATGLQTNELGGTLRTGAAQGCQGSR